MQEIEIDLKRWIQKILQYWRFLLIGMLVGIIVATLVGGMMSAQQAEEARQALEEQLLNPDSTDETEPIIVPEVVYFSVEYVAFGIALGVFVVAGYVTIIYVSSGKLKSTNDILQGFGLDVIGVISSRKVRRNDKFGAIDQFIDRCFLEGKSVPEDVNNQLISLDLCLIAKKHGITDLCLTGNVPKEIVMPILESVKTSGEQLNVIFEELAICSPDKLEKMLGTNGVVLFERIGYSTYADIEKELQYCKRYGIPVLGCVVAE